MFNKLLSCLLLSVLAITVFGCDRRISEPEATLRISSEVDPQTLDPRLVRDLSTATVIHMLYEGLTRLDEEGYPIFAAAEDVNISDDQKTYTFKLRKAKWNNGKPLTAYDFEKTWKSVLDPNFPAPNAYQLYVIKGAKAAKEDKASLDLVGIKATDDNTLVVNLENPTPYFLNLTSSYFYYPVSSSMRHNKEGDKITPQNIVTNGPFKLEEFSHHNQLTAIKNPSYWDSKSVNLDKIQILIVDNPTALSMFERNELDWVGSPMGTIPTDALATLKNDGKLQIQPAAGIYLFRFNTEKPPLNNVKMRNALSLALNRQELIDHVLQGNQIAAKGLIPPSFINHSPFYRDHNATKALELFKEVLTENHLSLNDLPTMTICYGSSERAHKIAQVAQQQWKQALGLDIQLQSCESKVFYERLKTHDYQIGIGSWFADIRDPISFLEVFKYKDNGTNNTQWENSHYVQLLNLSSQANTPAEREKLLLEAELKLIEEMPIAPLFFSAYNYLVQPNVKDVYFSELGYLDFKNASK